MLDRVAEPLTARWRSIALLTICVIGWFALVVGLATHGVHSYSHRPLIAPMIVGALGAVAFGWALREERRWAAAVPLAAAALLFGPAAVTVLVITLLTALALGLLVFRMPEDATALDLLLRVTAGLAVLVGLLQVALHVRINWSPVYLAVAGTAILTARRGIRRGAAVWWTRSDPSRTDKLGNGTAALAALLFAALLAGACYAITPESGYDALASHLMVVRWVSWNGFWHFDPLIFDRALMPLGAEGLFSWTYVLGGEAAMKLLNTACFWLTTGLVLAHAALPPQRCEAPPGLTLLGLIALAVTPLTVLVTQQLFQETVTTLFVTAAVISLSRAWRDPGNKPQGMMTFLLLGAACASKVQALFFGGIGLAAVANLCRGRGWQDAFRANAAGIALFALVGLVPYALATAATGNPFFPFQFGQSFDPRWVGKASADILYRMTFETHAYLEARDGAFGFQHLLLIPLLLTAGLMSQGGGRRIVAAVLLLFIVAMVSQAQYARYLFYAMPPLLLLLPAAWAMLGSNGRALLAAGIVLATVLNVAAYRAIWTPNFALRQILQPQRFATQIPEERQVVAAINATHGADSVVYFAGLPFTAGLDGTAYTVYSQLRLEIDAAHTPEEVEHTLRSHGITHVVISTERNMNALPVALAPAFIKMLAERMVEVPLGLSQVRLFAFAPP
jgi:hypothetical protein